MFPKYLRKPKYDFLIKKYKTVGIKHLNDLKIFIEYSQYLDDVYNKIDDWNPNRKRNILIVFHDMITSIMTDNKFQAIIKELFIKCKKFNISLVFITQSCFKKILLLIISESIDHKDCVSIYRKCTSEPYYFLTIDTTLPASKSLKCRRNILLPL